MHTRTLLSLCAAATCCAALNAVPARAAGPLAPQTPAAEAERPAPKEYLEAVRLIKQGRRFERAAALLEEAATKAPDDYRIPAALGCACAGRVASLLYAGSFAEALAKERAAHPARLAEWERDQKDPDSDGYGDPKPVLLESRVFAIKDDGVPYGLTPAQLREKTAALAKRAVAAFAKAEELAKMPAEKAEAAYLRGWGLRLLRTYAAFGQALGGLTGEGDGETTSPAADLFPAPEAGEMVSAFTRAADADPKGGAYWRALGDVLSGEKQQAAYRAAAALAPRDPLLWYRLYELTAADEKPASRARALADLRQAVRYDRANAWLAYEEAAYLLKPTRFEAVGPAAMAPETTPPAYQQAVSPVRDEASRKAAAEAKEAVKGGNAAPELRYPIYRTQPPKLLAVAWGYANDLDVPFPALARLRALARALSGVAAVEVRSEQNPEAGRETARLVVAMGARIAKDWPTAEDPKRREPTIIQTLVGVAISAIGYKLLIRVEELAGDAPRVAAVTAENEAFRKAVEDYRKAVQVGLGAASMFDMY